MTAWRYQPSLRDLARQQAPEEAAVERLVEQVEVAVERPAARPRRPGLALALAAGAITALFWFFFPDKRVDVALQAPHAPRSLDLVEGAALSYQGLGHAAGRPEALVIRWESGRLTPEVAPGQGIGLTVKTPEATVTVTGTRFSVERDALGTAVAVERGRVQARCRGEAARSLGPEQGLRCYRSAATALHHARQRLAEGASPQQADAIVQRALALESARGGVARELQVLRMRLLADGGEGEEALQLAESYLASGSEQRRAEVLDLASRLAFAQGGCARARPLLEVFCAESQAAPAAAVVQLADCLVSKKPQRALDLLQELGLDTLDEPSRVKVDTRIRQLREAITQGRALLPAEEGP